MNKCCTVQFSAAQYCTMNKQIIEGHAIDKAFTGNPASRYHIFLIGQDLNPCNFSMSLAH